jgi:hypothetical protein
MEIMLTKTLSGALIPLDPENEQFKRFKSGSIIRCEVKEMRNGKFFRKWWALVKIAFDLWTETGAEIEYKGDKVLPNFDRFRKDVTVLAGYFEATYNVKNEVRLEPKSLQWSKMTEMEFSELYKKTVTVIIEKIIPNRGLTAEELDNWVNRVIDFA